MNIWSKEQTRDFVKIVKLCIAAHFVHRVHRLLQSLSSLKFLLGIKVDTYTPNYWAIVRANVLDHFFSFWLADFFHFSLLRWSRLKKKKSRDRSVVFPSLYGIQGFFRFLSAINGGNQAAISLTTTFHWFLSLWPVSIDSKPGADQDILRDYDNENERCLREYKVYILLTLTGAVVTQPIF